MLSRPPPLSKPSSATAPARPPSWPLLPKQSLHPHALPAPSALQGSKKSSRARAHTPSQLPPLSKPLPCPRALPASSRVVVVATGVGDWGLAYLTAWAFIPLPIFPLDMNP